MNEYRQTNWTRGRGHEYGVELSPGFNSWCDRQRMPLFESQAQRTFNPHRITRREHVLYVRRAACERRPAPEVETFKPLAWLADDVREGRMPRGGATVEGKGRYIDGVRADGRVMYRTVRVTASGYMVQLERLYRDYAGHTRSVAALMSHEASGEGRGTIGGVERIPGAVNGTEVRHSPRWTQSRRALITTTVVTRDASTGRLVETQAPCDWHCYSVKPDGTRERFTVERKASERKASKASTIARLAAVAGNNAEGNSA